MKNVHVLPTDQPSKLGYISESQTYHLYNNDVFLDELANAINIYITSDEEIISSKDWFIDIKDKRNHLHQVGYGLDSYEWTEQYDPQYYKKIILTTDPTLIANGVQAIDDEFLEWFVKNPICEEVEIEKGYLGMAGFIKSTELISKDKLIYKIIIPQEEPKQEKKPHSFCETPEEKCTMNYCDDNGCQNRKRHLVESREQETLEEAAMVLYPEDIDDHDDNSMIEYDCNLPERIAFRAGAKWQAERMYSEKDLDTFRKFMIQEQNFSKSCLDVFIKKFKRK
jgi:hypothetical protein